MLPQGFEGTPMPDLNLISLILAIMFYVSLGPQDWRTGNLISDRILVHHPKLEENQEFKMEQNIFLHWDMFQGHSHIA